jgi:hypothetical protein
MSVLKRQKISQDRLFYHWEDEVLSRAAEVQFSFLTTFREVDSEGKKVNF